MDLKREEKKKQVEHNNTIINHQNALYIKLTKKNQNYLRLYGRFTI